MKGSRSMPTFRNAEPAGKAGLPEKIGTTIGAVVFFGVCALLLLPMVRHFFF